MTDFEYLESQGQTSIFDYLEITPDSKRNKSFLKGDKVYLRIYMDEFEYVRKTLPHCLNEGHIIEVHDGFYSVKFGHETMKVDGDKLLLA